MGRQGHKRQNELTEVFGWTESFISMLLSGRRMPSLDNAVKIERLTGIPVAAWSSSDDDNLAPTGTDGRAKSRRHR